MRSSRLFIEGEKLMQAAHVFTNQLGAAVEAWGHRRRRKSGPPKIWTDPQVFT